MWMGDTAIPWLVVERTHSPVQVGILVFCRYAPFTLFGLFAGAFADRFDNRRMLIATQSSSMIVVGVLTILTFAHATPLWAIYALAACSGAAVVFDASPRNTLIFQLVGRKDIKNAVALNAGLANSARIVGPAFAGIVIAVASVGVCFAVNTVTFLAVLTVLLLMRPEELVQLDRGATRPNTFSAIREGIAYVMREPMLKFVMATTAVIAVVGFNFRILMPVLASKTLSLGAVAFGLLYASFSAGALTGALFAATTEMKRWKLLLVGVGGFSMALLVMAPLRSVWPVGVFLFLIGIGFSFLLAGSQAIIQLTAPDRYRGRVVGLWFFIYGGLTPIGGLLAGWLAAVGGTELAFSIAGGSGLLVTVAGIVLMRDRWRGQIAPSAASSSISLAESPSTSL
jgi:MFS family permease